MLLIGTTNWTYIPFASYQNRKRKLVNKMENSVSFHVKNNKMVYSDIIKWQMIKNKKISTVMNIIGT